MKYRTIRSVLSVLGCSSVFVWVGLSPSHGNPEETRIALARLEENTGRWIELQRRLAEEKNRWESEHLLLNHRLTVLTEEQASLQQNFDSYKLANELFEKSRNRVLDNIGVLKAAGKKVELRLVDFEKRMLALAASLPDPLGQTIGPLLRQIESRHGDDERSIADRAQTLVAVISAVNEFANSLNLTHTVRTLADDGSEFDVKVLYWGLAFAYATNRPGTRAWFLRPGPQGWSWEDRSELAPRFKAVIDVYEKQIQPELVTLPAELAP